MASLFKENNQTFRIQFNDGNGNRKSVRLGKVPKKAAETIRSRVEEIISCRLAGIPLTPETSSWLGNASDDLHEKLATAGLVAPRCTAELGQYLTGYINRRKDVKIATVIRWNLDRKKLIGYFGEDRSVGSITRQDAENYKQYLFENKHARATISKFLSNARMFFNGMLADEIIQDNPFDGVSVTAVVDESRNVHVSRSDVYAAMEAAPDADWRAIIALSRFGGLQCPSEILSLKWENVLWQRERILVTSPKTEHHPDGQRREIPLFKELVVPLSDAWNTRPDNAVFVISRHRSLADETDNWARCNLRKPFLDILKISGITPWPKLFHAMRKACENDLVDAGFPLVTVIAWIGHTYKVAQKHYLRAQKEHFERAVEMGTEPNSIKYQKTNNAHNSVQKAVQQASEIVCTDLQQKSEVPENIGSFELMQVLATKQVAEAGLEPAPQ